MKLCEISDIVLKSERRSGVRQQMGDSLFVKSPFAGEE